MTTPRLASSTNSVAETSRAETCFSNNDAATTPQTSETPAAGSASLSDRWASSLIVELFVNNVLVLLFDLSVSPFLSVCLHRENWPILQVLLLAIVKWYSVISHNLNLLYKTVIFHVIK